MKRGSLTIVGTGIRILSQITVEAREAIVKSEKLLYATDDITGQWLRSENSSSESLHLQHRPGEAREATYESMVERILQAVRENKQVCVVYYGHPGVLVYASHRAIRIARGEGFQARMLPGISAEDALLADLEIDLTACGYSSYESTDFLIRRRKFDPVCHLILWMPDSIGSLDYQGAPNRNGLRILKEELSRFYPAKHSVILYQAAQIQGSDPVISPFPLDHLEQIPDSELVPYATLYVPPLQPGLLPDAKE